MDNWFGFPVVLKEGSVSVEYMAARIGGGRRDAPVEAVARAARFESSERRDRVILHGVEKRNVGNAPGVAVMTVRAGRRGRMGVTKAIVVLVKETCRRGQTTTKMVAVLGGRLNIYLDVSTLVRPQVIPCVHDMCSTHVMPRFMRDLRGFVGQWSVSSRDQ